MYARIIEGRVVEVWQQRPVLHPILMESVAECTEAEIDASTYVWQNWAQLGADGICTGLTRAYSGEPARGRVRASAENVGQRWTGSEWEVAA